ncbi:glycosyltransferase [Pseudomonas sp. TMW22090]|uniref:glycosyltransferase n=1 Tax=Pseudomonas sp. TMW22090 TaxID=2506434 RepID=UPI001F0E6B50|nr:glycosyltransferase [Pseudomonas sp. TMW22090]MCH4880457.1 glycosyltransferase [Pseudomonas sp. TMW22090]
MKAIDKVNLIVFPYRSSHFKKKYGTSVRDIQIIEILKTHPAIDNILIVERPLSIYELMLGRFSNTPGHLIDYSLDLLGPLKGREWTENCYDNTIPKVKELTKLWKNLIVLDFTPIAKIHKKSIDPCFYWYDMIDNFKKHNRFSKLQKQLVSEKYNLANNNADLITGVTEIALDEFSNLNTITMPNGVFPHDSYDSKVPAEFKYGFFGFITDKFDVDFIKNLAKTDSSARFILCGEILDSSVAKQLKSIDNVTLHGRFSRGDTARLASQFEVGIIPYRKDKSHDGSPLKLYEYMWFGKPVLTSIDYEYSANFIINYNKLETLQIVSEVDVLLSTPSISQHIKGSLDKEMHTEFRVNKIIEYILQKIRQ